MRVHCIAGALALLLAGCSPSDADSSNAAQPVPQPSATPKADAVTSVAAPISPLGGWLIGTWSYDETCTTDLAVRYNADGSVDNAGETGRWTLAGDTVTEHLTERFDMEKGGAVKLDPPETRSYTVAQRDATHGLITIENRKVPIHRC